MTIGTGSSSNQRTYRWGALGHYHLGLAGDEFGGEFVNVPEPSACGDTIEYASFVLVSTRAQLELW